MQKALAEPSNTHELYVTLGLSKGIRVAIFETSTCITTTGFSTVSYSNWNSFGILVLIAFMIMGGGTGSTAGGMKQYRVFLLTKSVYWENQLYSQKALATCHWCDQDQLVAIPKGPIGVTGQRANVLTRHCDQTARGKLLIVAKILGEQE